MDKSIGIFLLLLGACCLSLSSLSAQNWANDFILIDQRARKSPRKLHQDLPALTAYLCEDAGNELEKVRAIYVWITTHIGYDNKANEQDKRINHFIRDILERKVALCFGYAQLFKKMCDLAGIESQIISGYAKGTSGVQLPLEEPNHSWNAVKINDQWHLLDATWGSSTISNDNDFVLISNDDYFLIRPEQFVRTHLPGNPMWQLLSRPVTAGAFMGIADLPKTVIDTNFAFQDSLAAFFEMSLPRQNLYNYELSYTFYPTPENGSQLGHAIMDYAGILSDTLEQLPPEASTQQRLALHAEIIKYCRQAQALTSLYAWQQELFVGTLINQAVLLYNHQGEEQDEIDTSDEAVIGLLEEASTLLADGKDSYFNRMARRQCASYLEVIRGETR